MLEIFRRYQKSIFLCSTVFVAISFLFFGTLAKAPSAPSEVSDESIAKMLGGDPLKRRKVALMSYFLSSSAEDVKLSYRGGLINLFNDGVLDKDILSMSLCTSIANLYASQIKNDMDERLQKAASHSLYKHPKSQRVSAASVYHSIDPSIMDVVSRISKSTSLNAQESFSLLSSAYEKQKKIPSDMVQRMLSYHQSKLPLEDRDPRLEQADLSLLGFHSLQDFLGPTFIEISAQFIMNAASYAKSLGMKISVKEARDSLMENLARGLKFFSQESLSAQDLKKSYYHQLRILGVDEMSCIELWQDVLLFRKLFQKANNLIQIDPSFVQKQTELAKELFSIDLYEMPKALALTDFSSLMKLQLYIDAIAPVKLRGDVLALPKETLPLSEIEKKHPELVQKSYVLEYAECKKNDVLAQISLKDTWSWQLDENHWSFIKSQFPSLSAVSGLDVQSRAEALEGLSVKEKDLLDTIAQNKILDERPALIKQCLQSANRKTKEVKLNNKGFCSPFIVDNHMELMRFLDKAPLPSESAPSAQAIAAAQKLCCYSDNGHSYYSIKLVSRDENKRLQTFLAANESGYLDLLLSKRLEEAYPEAKRKEPSLYMNANGSWKLIDDVQDHLIRFAFADVLRAIEAEYMKHYGSTPPLQMTHLASFYTQYRPLYHLRQARVALQSDSEDSKWVALANDKSYQREIDKQWLLVKTHREFSLSEANFFISFKSLDVEEGTLSPIVSLKNGNLSLFKMLQKKHRDSLEEAASRKVEESIDREAKKVLARDLLQKMRDQGAIALQMQEASR